MRSVTQNFFVDRGSDFLRGLRILVLNELVSGETDTIKWTIKSDDPEDTLVVRQIGTGIFYDPDSPDVIVLTLDSPVTSAFSLAKRYRHEMEITISERTCTVMRGNILVRPKI